MQNNIGACLSHVNCDRGTDRQESPTTVVGQRELVRDGVIDAMTKVVEPPFASDDRKSAFRARRRPAAPNARLSERGRRPRRKIRGGSRFASPGDVQVDGYTYPVQPRERGATYRGIKVNTEDVNQACGEHEGTKREELSNDAAGDEAALNRGVRARPAILP